MKEKLFGLGAVLGAFGAGFCCLAPILFSLLGVGTVTRHAALLLVYGATMMGVCALACIG
ncbi:MAG: hypothetical protein HYS14_08915, partial [Candidatus Rokubacteria bacterium]|nr:hypothetical protein [Candidatus Rokubacteria bacterium]